MGQTEVGEVFPPQFFKPHGLLFLSGLLVMLLCIWEICLQIAYKRQKAKKPAIF
jgi:hypothetical protein